MAEPAERVWAGTLEKKAHKTSLFNRSGWKKRFYVLYADGTLKSFDKEGAKKEKSVVKVRMINVPPAPAEKSKGHPFELFVVDPSGASQSLSLNAPTHEDLFTVLAAVNRVLASTITSPLEASKADEAPSAPPPAAVNGSDDNDDNDDDTKDKLPQSSRKAEPNPVLSVATLAPTRPAQPPPPPAAPAKKIPSPQSSSDPYVNRLLAVSRDNVKRVTQRTASDSSVGAEGSKVSPPHMIQRAAPDSEPSDDESEEDDASDSNNSTGTGSGKEPLFNLDIRLKNGSQVMIPYFEGTDPAQLALSFGAEHDLSANATTKLHTVIMANIEKVNEMRAEEGRSPVRLPSTRSSPPPRQSPPLPTAAPSTDNDASTAENDASVDDEKVDIGEEEDVDDEPVQESFDDKRDGVSASPISTEKAKRFYIPSEAQEPVRASPAKASSPLFDRSGSRASLGSTARQSLATDTDNRGRTQTVQAPNSRESVRSKSPSSSILGSTVASRARSAQRSRGPVRATDFERATRSILAPGGTPDRAVSRGRMGNGNPDGYVVPSPQRPKSNQRGAQGPQSPGLNRPLWKPVGNLTNAANTAFFSRPLPLYDPIVPDDEDLSGWDEDVFGSSSRPRSVSRGRGRASIDDARSIHSASTTRRRHTARTTLLAQPKRDVNLDSEDEEKKRDWGATIAKPAGTHGVAKRPQSAGRMRPAPASQPTPTVTARPQVRMTTAVVGKAKPVGKPVSSAYSHVKPKVYEATEAHVRSSRAAISAANHNVVTQFQVVVGSDHPIRRVSTEASPNSKIVAAGKSGSRPVGPGSKFMSAPIAHSMITHLSADQLQRELQQAREEQARLARMALAEAERRKQSEEEVARLQSMLRAQSVQAPSQAQSVRTSQSPADADAVIADFQESVSKLRSQIAGSPRLDVSISPTTVALREKLEAERRQQGVVESELQSLRNAMSTLSTTAAAEPKKTVPGKQISPSEWGRGSADKDFNLSLSEDEDGPSPLAGTGSAPPPPPPPVVIPPLPIAKITKAGSPLSTVALIPQPVVKQPAASPPSGPTPSPPPLDNSTPVITAALSSARPSSSPLSSSSSPLSSRPLSSKRLQASQAAVDVPAVTAGVPVQNPGQAPRQEESEEEEEGSEGEYSDEEEEEDEDEYTDEDDGVELPDASPSGSKPQQAQQGRVTVEQPIRSSVLSWSNMMEAADSDEDTPTDSDDD